MKRRNTPMKKFLAMLLAMVMMLGCVAFAETVNPDDIPDTVTAEDGKYEIAFVTDVGQLKDKSFNQGTWNGVKLYATANGLTYKYYQPANGDQATDDDRYDAMKAACEGGAKVVVCAGFMQGTALAKAAAEYTDVKFVFIDGWQLGLANVAPIAFAEEQSGYLAGYAVVKEGFTKLGFSGGGGGTNPACIRYGYGFAQGANAAAAEMGVNVELKYSWQYGASFSASAELQTMISGWYETGTEIVFACGGSMFSSIVAAASANDACVVGVDVDQSYESETVVTSALKGLSSATAWAIGKYYAGEWETVGDVATSLGANNDAVGLPTDTWSLTAWTVDEYNALLAAIKDGTVTIDSTVLENDGVVNVEFSNLKVIYE
ncbi:MAG: BMP family ABC transporter substrate-binding protein [Clostridia bacterium]|nr:BMP family ABC transporter substrate-binding protein [Clostridia bacterium]